MSYLKVFVIFTVINIVFFSACRNVSESAPDVDSVITEEDSKQNTPYKIDNESSLENNADSNEKKNTENSPEGDKETASQPDSPKEENQESKESDEQDKLREEAEKDFEELSEKVESFIAEKMFDEALEALASYKDKYAEEEFINKVDDKILQVEKLRKEEEEHRFNEQVKATAEECLKSADALAAEKKFDDALNLLNLFPEKYKTTQYYKLIQEKIEKIVKLKADEERRKFLKEAELEFFKRMGKAEELAHKKDFDAALKIIKEYPSRYNKTEWQIRLAEVEKNIIEQKNAHEEHLQFLANAKVSAEKAISSARGFCAKNNFEEALKVLADYPQIFSKTDSAKEVALEIESVNKLKSAYKERQQFLKAALEEYQGRIKKAEELMKHDKYNEALEVLAKYPGEYAGTEWNKKVDAFSAEVVLPAKEKYEERQRFLAEAKTEFDKTIKETDLLITAKQFDNAVMQLSKFPEKYNTLYGSNIKAKKEEIKNLREEYQRKKIMTFVGAAIIVIVILLSTAIMISKRLPTTDE
ncbi:MAG: hypothetical protein ABIH42_02620 [Planctomycetota bacterium]